MYYTGLIAGLEVPHDYVQAHMWFRKAAAQGHEGAAHLLDAIAGKSAKTPTLRDKPDRELCLSLPYGNPDFAKEAERRELTEKKCKEILGQ